MRKRRVDLPSRAPKARFPAPTRSHSRDNGRSVAGLRNCEQRKVSTPLWVGLQLEAPQNRRGHPPQPRNARLVTGFRASGRRTEYFGAPPAYIRKAPPLRYFGASQLIVLATNLRSTKPPAHRPASPGNTAPAKPPPRPAFPRRSSLRRRGNPRAGASNSPRAHPARVDPARWRSSPTATPRGPPHRRRGQTAEASATRRVRRRQPPVPALRYGRSPHPPATPGAAQPRHPRAGDPADRLPHDQPPPACAGGPAPAKVPAAISRPAGPRRPPAPEPPAALRRRRDRSLRRHPPGRPVAQDHRRALMRPAPHAAA